MSLQLHFSHSASHAGQDDVTQAGLNIHGVLHVRTPEMSAITRKSLIHMHMHASASLPPYTTIVCNMHASRLTRYGYDYTPALLNCFIQIHSRRQARYQNLFFSQYAWHVTLFTPHTIIFISVCMIEKFLGLSIMSQICLKCPKTAVWSIDLVAD